MCRSCDSNETDSGNGTCADISSNMDPDSECQTSGMERCCDGAVCGPIGCM